MENTLETETGLAILDKREAGLKALKEEYEGLTISGIDDREGYKKVSEARKILKGERVQITKEAKQLRDGANKFCSTVIARERELIKIIEPIEERLYDQEKAIDEEKERLEAEAEKKEADRVQDRVNQLAKFNHAIDFFEAKNISDEAFNELITQVEIDFNQEQAKKEAERLEREAQEKEAQRLKAIEEERLANERAELERKRAEYEEKEKQFQAEQEKKDREFKAEQARIAANQKAEQDELERQHKEREAKIKSERDELERQKREHEEKLRKEQEEKDRVAREEQIRIDTEARVKREEEERIAREKAEAERKAALAPDKEKLLNYAKDLNDFILTKKPSVASDEAIAVVRAADKRLVEICNYIELTCKKL